jgi:hypothetical protein
MSEHFGDGPGITSKSTYTPSVYLGDGAHKYVTMGNHTTRGSEFSYAGLRSAGGPAEASYYAIIKIPDFPATRLYDELLLQFDFSDVVLATLTDGSKITLSPRIFGLHIKDRGTYYGKKSILGKLFSLSNSNTDGDDFNFTLAVERVNYNMGNGKVETPANFINKYPYKLIELIGHILSKNKILLDIKIPNLLVKCYNRSCYLGVMDLDKKFADNIGFGWYPLKGLVDAFLGTVNPKLAQQYMVFMVCFVGSNNGLTPETKAELLHMVGLTDTSDIRTFKVGILNQMLSYEMLQQQIRHYLGFHADTYKTTEAVSAEFMKHYIQGQPRTPGVPGKTMPMTPDSSSYGGGKSRRKYKPKSRKTRRKRSLHNHIS